VYPPSANPVIRVQIDGFDVVPSFPLVPVARLVWVDEVVNFRPGHEAKPGINTHNKPDAALWRCQRQTAGYEIVPQGDDVTVFVAPDESLLPYLVEASLDGEEEWAPPSAWASFPPHAPFALPTRAAESATTTTIR
jgi:hypothetical protein